MHCIASLIILAALYVFVPYGLSFNPTMILFTFPTGLFVLSFTLIMWYNIPQIFLFCHWFHYILAFIHILQHFLSILRFFTFSFHKCTLMSGQFYSLCFFSICNLTHFSSPYWNCSLLVCKFRNSFILMNFFFTSTDTKSNQEAQLK